jgi:uncharacterized membrane protein
MKATPIEREVLIPDVVDGPRCPTPSRPIPAELGRSARVIAVLTIVVMAVVAFVVASAVIVAAVLVSAVVLVLALIARLGAVLLPKAVR